jgi:hypothetical protein
MSNSKSQGVVVNTAKATAKDIVAVEKGVQRALTGVFNIAKNAVSKTSKAVGISGGKKKRTKKPKAKKAKGKK